MKKKTGPSFRPSLFAGLLALCLVPLASGRSFAQYRTTETTGVPNQQGETFNNNAPAQSNSSSSGPVRLARFSYNSGDVSWRPDDSTEWAPAARNLPLREGAQIWVTHGGRANIQFDDGSDLRLGNGALVTLKALYSDADGEFTQVTLKSGLATLATRNQHSVYQIDAPIASVVANGRSKFRLGADNGLELAVRRGQATVEDPQGKTTVTQGHYLYLADASSPFHVRSLPGEDSWDRWNDNRDHYLYEDVPTYHHVPSNIALVSGDLDSYGSWRDDPRNGWVWAPRVHHPHWRPYSEGHWTWVAPYGWTWVADDPWGWAPYHYGTWVDEPYGWAWRPGPAVQYWSPAVVSFSDYNGSVCWAPLAPEEVHYPSTLAVGFSSGAWSLFFSIGQAGCYYPTGPTYCEGRPFNNAYVNHLTYVNNITNVTNIYNNTTVYNSYVTNNRFRPRNAMFAAGATVATAAAFGGRGAYRPASNAAAFFTRGRIVGAPSMGRAPFSGPPAARPTRLALTPTRSFQPNVRPPAAILRRSVFLAPQRAIRPGLPPSVLSRSPSRPAGGFARTNGRPVARIPAHTAPNAFNARNRSAAAIAASRARGALGLPGGRGPGNTVRPGGRFANAPSPMRRATTGVVQAQRAAPRRAVGMAPPNQRRPIGRTGPAQTQAAHAPINRPRPNGRVAQMPRQFARSPRPMQPAPHPGGRPNAAPRRVTRANPPRPNVRMAPAQRQAVRAPAYRPRPNVRFTPAPQRVAHAPRTFQPRPNRNVVRPAAPRSFQRPYSAPPRSMPRPAPRPSAPAPRGPARSGPNKPAGHPTKPADDRSNNHNR